MADVKQTMINVKKSDGTTVKMSLSDFKKYQAALVQKNTSSAAPVLPPVAKVNSLPAKIQNESVATSTPVVKSFINEAGAELSISDTASKSEPKQAPTITPPKPPVSSISQRPSVRLPVKPIENKPKVWSKEDSSSPLTEKPSVENNKKIVEVVPQEDIRGRAERLVQGVGLPIPEGVKPRMINLVSSVISGARDRNMAIEYATRPIANGGLGLSEEQVSLLMKKINTEIPSDVRPYSATHVLPENLRQKVAQPGQSVLPDKFESVANPVRKLDQLMRAEAVRSTPLSVVSKPPTSQAAAVSSPKMKLTDIKPPVVVSREKLTLGPVDEFANLTLQDWRRMAVNTEGSLNLMQNKFSALMNESYTLFLAGRDGWRTSPLFNLYLNTIKSALGERRPISELLMTSGEDVLTEAEFKALVELNDSISN